MPWSRTKLSDPRRSCGATASSSTADEHAESRRPAGRLREALRPAAERRAARHHLRGLPHRADRGHAQRPDDGAAHRRRIGAARVHELEHRPLRADAAASLLGTVANPMKFNRFARRGARAGATRADAGRCAGRCSTSRGSSAGWPSTRSGTGSCRPRKATAGPTRWRASRTPCSAITSRLGNYAVGNAPVNYPPVWNIWKFDWVQYNASVSQPMARNIGESMGTGAKYALMDRYGRPLPADQRFRSTAHPRQPAHDRADAVEAAAAGVERGRARPDRPRQGRARQGAVRQALRPVPRAVHRAARRSRRATRR